MTHHPLNIYQNIFQFLDRNEIEKCRLTCRHWSTVIMEQPYLLPYRMIKEFKIVSTKGLFPYVIADRVPIFSSEDIEKVTHRAGYLKFCTIEELCFDIDYFVRRKKSKTKGGSALDDRRLKVSFNQLHSIYI